ncbi:arginine biosynthesis protein ArgJ [Teratosphaeria nubilosa]|uniref:Arginine biosynthesis bifunctional protein ArgJ, mitochondrial n=1 Tax=Teratosphaeria nubilosa TaxID=161662 RepID=A0A6G1KVR8_9PEZI|nr:arginine biosynthesis protein ArgJ [Teratosphaeria nubilosa]
MATATKTSWLRRAFHTDLQQIRHYSAPGDRSIPAAKQKYVPTSGTYPKGFQAGTAHAGVKASNTKYDDITMVVSDRPAAAAAVFTRNVFKAAPVVVSRASLSARNRAGQGFRGVVVNSGCANAVTGKVGLEHAALMARETDKCFDSEDPSEPPQTLVMSTGVIGQILPISKITDAIPKAHAALGDSHDHWLNAAKAICTTDTFPKLLTRTFTLPSHPETEYRIAGTTKGAGMIHPNMATLLGIVCTDAKITPSALDTFLRRANRKSFNCISIDGDTSTNDTVSIFANGAAAPDSAAPIDVEVSDPSTSVSPTSGSPTRVSSKPQRPRTTILHPDAQAFDIVLTKFMQDLAQLVVRDGEGATKFVTIRVRSDKSLITAHRVAESIAKSSLVKTALYGKDANWGRILCAIGYTPGIMDAGPRGLSIDQVLPERTSVSFIPADGSAPLHLLVQGEPQQVDETRAKEILEMEDLEILVRLEDGPVVGEAALKRGARVGTMTKEAVYWTCDLSHEYVTINGDYRT